MIKAVNLTKKFGNFTALSAINCTIPEGCIYGLVGSNGAGKSTFIRLLAGIYRPDSGTATIDDKSIYENPEVKRGLPMYPMNFIFCRRPL